MIYLEQISFHIVKAVIVENSLWCIPLDQRLQLKCLVYMKFKLCNEIGAIKNEVEFVWYI